MNVVKISFQSEPYHYWFFDEFDEESCQFEVQLKARGTQMISLRDQGVIIPWPRLSFWQSSKYLQHIQQKYFVLQMMNSQTQELYQVAVIVNVSRFKIFQSGVVSYWIPLLKVLGRLQDEQDQEALFRTLTKLCRKYTKMMSLRVHAYAPGHEMLQMAESIFHRTEMRSCLPLNAEKTRLIDLRYSLDELEKQFSGRIRARLKIKKPEQILIREIQDKIHKKHLQTALNDTFQRSVGKTYNYDFDSLLIPFRCWWD